MKNPQDPPIALDTEFHAERRYRPKLCLIRIREPGRDATLVDPLQEPVDLSALSHRALLLHAPQQDLPLLARHTKLEPGPVVDTQVLAGFAGFGYPRALGDLLHEVLGQPKGPREGLTDWTRRPLSEIQQAYALRDVEHLHTLSEALWEAIPVPHREAAQAACAQVARQAMEGVRPEQSWKSIAAAPWLDARSRMALRALATWRERKAAQADQPARQIASDAVLVDLARRRPDRDRLMENRKTPKRMTRLWDEVAPCLQWEDEGDGWPDTHAEREDLALIRARLELYARVNATETGLASRLLLPPEFASELAVSFLRDRRIALDDWRRSFILGDLSRLVTGLDDAEFVREFSKFFDLDGG